ncbi:MAG: hypothetical protein PHW53_01795 [Patescibacteria group bacterium]|nr:hypothetical protein [Patescibacteria group bacterium]
MSEEFTGEINTEGFKQEAIKWRTRHPTNGFEFKRFLFHLGIDRNRYEMTWWNILGLTNILLMNIRVLEKTGDWGRLVALGDRWQFGSIVDQWAERAIASAIDGGLPSQAAKLVTSHRVSPTAYASALSAYEIDCAKRKSPSELRVFCTRLISGLGARFI